MGHIFDGRLFSNKETIKLVGAVEAFVRSRGRTPQLVSVYDPELPASRAYTAIKAKKASEIGVVFENVSFQEGDIYERIREWNADATVDGILIQTPFIGDQELIEMVSARKDVDGLREDSPYLQATVRAVLSILQSEPKIVSLMQNPATSIVVVGSKGRVGSGLMNYFHSNEFTNVVGMDSDTFSLEVLSSANVVISTTGVPSVIQADMVPVGVVAIDVGYPQGDFAPEVADKASFFTPVPGGVGPVTVVSLFKNLLNIS